MFGKWHACLRSVCVCLANSMFEVSVDVFELTWMFEVSVVVW